MCGFTHSSLCFHLSHRVYVPCCPARAHTAQAFPPEKCAKEGEDDSDDQGSDFGGNESEELETSVVVADPDKKAGKTRRKKGGAAGAGASGGGGASSSKAGGPANGFSGVGPNGAAAGPAPPPITLLRCVRSRWRRRIAAENCKYLEETFNF